MLSRLLASTRLAYIRSPLGLTPGTESERMKAFIYSSSTIIEPLGDPASQSRILNEPLEASMTQLLTRLRLEPVRIAHPAEATGERYLLLPDNLYLTGALLYEFLKAAAKESGTVALALRESAFTRFSTPLQDLRSKGEGDERIWIYPLVRVDRAGGGDGDPAKARPLVTHARTWNLPVWKAQDVPGRPKQFLPVTFHQAVLIESWYHIWVANVLAGPVWAARQIFRKRRAAWLLVKLSWSLVSYLPVQLALAISGVPVTIGGASLLEHVGRHLVIRGKRCRVHPTAVVIASELGDDVEVGPYTIVALSVLGNGVAIDACGEVRNSVVGDGTHLIHRPAFNAAICYPGCRISLVQASLLGRNASFGGEVRAYDLNLKGPVTIEHKGRVVPTGTSGLGTCVGHGAQLWGRISLAPGRVIPNGVMVIEDPHVVLQRVPADVQPGVIHAIRKGVLTPVGSSREGAADAAAPAAPRTDERR